MIKPKPKRPLPRPLTAQRPKVKIASSNLLSASKDKITGPPSPKIIKEEKQLDSVNPHSELVSIFRKINA